jgi:FkbM family methyltransferase
MVIKLLSLTGTQAENECMKKQLSEFFYKKYNTSFSQCGEDTILANLFSKPTGFYVDIGAFHPYKFSNTYLFYKKGWRGINIDAAPGSMTLFNKMRPHDINLEVAVSDTEENLTYYYLGENNPMNSFSRDFIEQLGNGDKSYKEIKIKTLRLEDILNKYAAGKEIDFFSMDVENLEINVLRSNNWNKFRPKVILLESFEKFTEEDRSYDVEIKAFLKVLGYNLITKTINGIFFLRNDILLNEFNHIIG